MYGIWQVVFFTYVAGGESVRKMRRTHSFESPDHEVIVAAGESSQTDCAAFIEAQQKLLHECNSAINYAPEDRDVVMDDDERTDSAGNMKFRDDHYTNTPRNSVPKISAPITKQPGLSGTKDYSDYVHIEHEEYKKQIQEHEKDRFGKSEPSLKFQLQLISVEKVKIIVRPYLWHEQIMVKTVVVCCEVFGNISMHYRAWGY